MVGGGVVGLTTALVLEATGVATTLVTDIAAGASPPELASAHAAASVLAHSVRSSRSDPGTRASTVVLETLGDDPAWGVRHQTHMELNERTHQPDPPYRDVLRGYRRVDHRSHGVPQRPGRPASGWAFDALFCDGPTYLAALRDEYRRLGGTVVDRRVTLASLARDGARHVVNCAGHRGPQLAASGGPDLVDVGEPLGLEPVEDPHGVRYTVGHYLRVRRPDLLRDADGRVLSYNYTPGPDDYPGPDGGAADVYCYPRDDAWVLGGSRLPVEGGLDDAERRAVELEGPTATLPDRSGRPVRIPRPIVELNDELIAQLSGGDVRIAEDVATGVAWAGYAYRAERAHPTESVRVSVGALGLGDERILVGHCYGHGSAGFTLSWGSALDLVDAMVVAARDPSVAPLPRRRGAGGGRHRLVPVIRERLGVDDAP